MLLALLLGGCQRHTETAQPFDPLESPGASPARPLRLDPGQIAAAKAGLAGHWAGVLVQERGALRLEVEITERDDGSLFAQATVPDWFGYAPLEPSPVVVDSSGISIESLAYGRAQLQFDPRYRQLVGEVGPSDAPVAVHLKPSLPPPERHLASELVRQAGSGVELAGTLWLPEGDGPHPAMLVIGGRGCSGRSEALGRVLPQYGMAVLAYDKRGTGESTGDCAAATFADLVGDALAMYRRLSSDPRIESASIGLWGGSAGAWTAQGVTEQLLDRGEPGPAFVVTWVGPGTSIAQQQRDSGVAIGKSLGLSAAQMELATEALEISLDLSMPRAEVYRRLNEIEAEIREQGWLEQMFEDTDFPASEQGVDTLWVRRFSFDPGPVLARMGDTPYLSVLGEQDPVVPFEINRAALEDSGLTAVQVVGVPGVGHGFEHGDELRSLPDGSRYFKFDTVEPMFFTATISFLRRGGFLRR